MYPMGKMINWHGIDLPRLIGRWVVQGTIRRQTVTHDVTFEWMLGQENVQMHEVGETRGALAPAIALLFLIQRPVQGALALGL